MAAVDKLMKSLEALKVVQPTSVEDTTQQKKKDGVISAKDKVMHCNNIADAICSPSMRSIADFPKWLGRAMDVFMLCCDDDNSDVRLMADECLNRTIKTLLDSHLGRLFVELYKEIKKDGAARSLRSALSRFGDICHLMRHQKCRPYTANLVPCLAKICQRKDEESVQETLATMISKIMPVLGQFTNDKEIKILLKAFLPNLTVNSANVRRAAANSLVCICRYSKRPSSFYSRILSALFDLILPVQEEKPASVILGVLLCLRHLVPHLSDALNSQILKGNINTLQGEEDIGVMKEQILKVYEITLYFTHHSDHNVITATLETLYQLLKTAPKCLQQSLVSPNGILKSLIYTSDLSKLSRARSESQSSVIPASALDESALEDDQDIYIPEKKEEDPLLYDDEHLEPLVGRTLSTDGDSEEVSEYSNLKVGPYIDESQLSLNSTGGVKFPVTPKRVPLSLKKGASSENIVDTDDEVWENCSSPSSGPGSKVEFKVVNIGSFTDPDIPLNYCSRLICSSFLLSGSSDCCISDKQVRISVKSLALGCLSGIFSLYPRAFFLPLHVQGEDIKVQKLWDVGMYANHSDPHLKGQASVMIGHLINHGLKESGGLWSNWIKANNIEGAPSLEMLLGKLTTVIKDDSSVAAKLGLVGLKQCLNSVIKSVNALEAIPVLHTLLQLKGNSYWLAKVELVDLVSSLSFKTIHYLEKRQTASSISSKSSNFQDKFLNQILVPLLGDEDFRVRQASASGLVRLIPHLLFVVDYPNKDPITAIAKEDTELFLDIAQKDSLHSTLPLVHALVKPFAVENSISFNVITESSLSRLLNLLITTLRTCTNKYLSFGCCHALCLLSEKYLVTLFPEAWNISFKEEKSQPFLAADAFRLYSQFNQGNVYIQEADLLSHLVSFITNTTLCLDLVAHQHVLQLTGNLLCGKWYKLLLLNHNKSASVKEQWNSANFGVSALVEKVFLHLMRLLNIYTHVLEEQSPIVQSNRPALPSLPNAPSLSPMKRKSKVKDETAHGGSVISKGSPNRTVDKADIEKDKNSNKISGSFGQFHSSSVYMKLFDILRGAHASYKISMDFQSSDKFCQLLKCTVNVLSQLFEIAESHEMGKHAEEILGYLKILMTMEPCASVQCVRQLLKCLFSTNLIAMCQEAQYIPGAGNKMSSSLRFPMKAVQGLYNTIITDPYTNFTHSLADQVLKSGSPEGIENYVSCLNWVKRGNDKLTSVLKSGSKFEKASLATLIRLFEGVVIRALQHYTTSSDIELQCQVLDLLAQLVQLRVNYCLLDADQIFINYVIKQFEFIEDGQILNADALIPRIFYFLILLSYERFHSKPIISVPKILQLCDGLIASGQPPDKYVVRALQPIIEDLFLIRSMNRIDLGKELDAQREVIISTLFKLVCYPQVLELFFLIVTHSRQESEDKWKKTSRQIVDMILPALSRQQIQVENQTQLNVLHKLLENVASNVFRPVDILLKALFSQPRDLNILPNLQRWTCMVLAVLRVMICQANEEAVLSRLDDMGITIQVFKIGLSCTYRCEKERLINLTTSSSELSSGLILARFFFQVVGVIIESLCNRVFEPSLKHADNTFFCQQIAHVLLYLMHMFQSGTFRRVTTSAMCIIKEETSDCPSKSEIFYSICEINEMFLKLSPFYPTLVIQWCNILTLLNCDSRKFWAQILQPCQETQNAVSLQVTHERPVFLPANLEMVRRGGVILLCDYVCENPTDVVQMTWLIVHHINDIIELSFETTVQDFVRAIHRNPAASGLLIQALINARFNLTPSFLKRALNCLENIHLSQSGKLLTLLVENFLNTHHLLILNICSNLACKRLELLFSDPASNQFSCEDVDKLLEIVKASPEYKRHSKFISMCEKVKGVISSEISPTSMHPLLQKSFQVHEIELNKEWYLKYVRNQCFNPQSPTRECATLLSQLKFEDTLAIMISKEFHLPILEQCLTLGAEIIASSEKYLSARLNDPFVGVTESSGSALYRSAQNVLMQHLTDLIALLPRTSKQRYRLYTLFSDEQFWTVLFHIVPATSAYLKTLEFVPDHDIPVDSSEDIVHLSILCCEALLWTIKNESAVSSELLKITLLILESTLKNPSLSSVIGSNEHVSWTCLTVFTIHQLVGYLQQDQVIANIVIPAQLSDNSFSNDQIQARKACIQMMELISWLEKSLESKPDIPEFLLNPLHSVIIGLARLPSVNSFARTPPVLWQLGWNPDLSGDFKNIVQTPPGEYLQDRDVLKQYIYRINLLGWISRQQFEETWMALLGVLSATPVDDIDGKEEDQEQIRTSCLAVKSITSLLLQTLFLPQPGNPLNSSFLKQLRDKPLAFQHTKCGKKLICVRTPIHKIFKKFLHYERFGSEIFNVNEEKIVSFSSYSLNQVSLEYLRAAAHLIEENEDVDGSTSSNSSPTSTNPIGVASYQQREESLSNAGLDIHSCLHFLLDLYSQWLSSQACPFTPLMLLTEVSKSVVALSDIFIGKAQFEWMLDTLLEVQKIHPAEDDIITQYLVFGIFKAAAVLGLEQDVSSKVRKLIESSLKSTLLPTRISTLHGLLYLFEHSGGDESFPILPIVTEYILKNLEPTNLTKPSSLNEDHVQVLWALTFYIMENYQDEVAEGEFCQKIYQLSLNLCGNNEVPSVSTHLTIMYGLERLLVAEILSGKEANHLLKVTVDRIKSGNPVCSLAALGLFLSCMYIGKSTNMWSNQLVADTPKHSEKALAGKQIDSEFLLVAMERVTTLFDRIRKCYPFEAEVICEILPSFLMEFFPVQEILNKIITEFLSSQQPHPQLMAKVIFEVFQYLHKQSQEEIIHEWVILSLYNFMQRSPVSMAVWSLSCFLISATTNCWVQALFPYVQNRMGKMEEEDKILFCTVGVHFRNQLKSEEQKQAYFATIQTAALPETPYSDLLNCL